MRRVVVKNASGRVFNAVGSPLKMRRGAFVTASGRSFSGVGSCFQKAWRMRSNASRSRSSLQQSEMRIYLAPFVPKMKPGVRKTRAS